MTLIFLFFTLYLDYNIAVVVVTVMYWLASVANALRCIYEES